MNIKFQVQFLEDAAEFLDTIEEKAREKIYFNIRKAQITKDKELFKKLSSEIWEFRTIYNKTHYRLFAFWDRTGNTDTLVIATHGIIKKTNRTLVSEIQKAEKLRKLYLEYKSQAL